MWVCKQSFPVLTWSSDVFVWSNLQSKADTHWTSPSKTNFPTVHLIHSPVSPVSSEAKIWWVFFSSFSRKFFQETLFFRFLTFLLWADVGLTGVLRIPSSPFFYFNLNSCVLFQLLFTPATGYRFKSLSDAPAHTIMEQVELLFNKEMRMRLAESVSGFKALHHFQFW